jgi:signal transduction histidine kinase
MKPAASAWSRTEAPGELALLLAVLLVVLPFLLTVLYFAFRAFDTPLPAPVATVERYIEPLVGARFDSAGFAALTNQAPDFSQPIWQTVALPDAVSTPSIIQTENASLARVWMRARYTLPADRPAPAQLAVYVTRVMGGAWSVWLNGRLVDANLANWHMQWNAPLYVKLPPGSLVPGQQATIDVTFPIRVTEGYAFGSMTIGDAVAVNRLCETRLFWQSILPKAAILITLLLGLISLHYWFEEREDHAYLRLAFAAIFWAIGSSLYLGDFLDDTASLWFNALNDAATTWLVCALTMFAIHFDKERWPRLEIGLVIYAVIVTVTTLPIWNWGVDGLIFQYYINLVLGFAVLAYFAWRAFSGGSYEFKVIMVAIWSLPLAALHTTFFVIAQRSPDSIDIYPFTAFIIFGAFLYIMQRRYLTARRSLVELNASLDQRLQQRETELAAQHRKLMGIEQERIVQQERQRIMRDMHDGIGTTLMSSLALAEHGELAPARTAAILRESLDELKLVIDSLEPIDDDITTLLAALRYRFGQRIEDAGIKIVWDMAELPPLPWLAPSHALQVLRIVQEALANVIKHARASEITISARPAARGDDRPGIVVRINDNGVGFDPSHARRGRGLDNLRRRAADLCATLNIHAELGHGCSVSLHLPLELPTNPL